MHLESLWLQIWKPWKKKKINLLYVVDVGRAVHENVVWQMHKDDAAKQAKSRKTGEFLLFAALVSHSRLLSCKYHTHRLLLAKFLCLVIHIWVDRSRTRAPPLLMTPASNRQTHTSKLFPAATYGGCKHRRLRTSHMSWWGNQENWFGDFLSETEFGGHGSCCCCFGRSWNL